MYALVLMVEVGSCRVWSQDSLVLKVVPLEGKFQVDKQGNLVLAKAQLEDSYQVGTLGS